MLVFCDMVGWSRRPSAESAPVMARNAKHKHTNIADMNKQNMAMLSLAKLKMLKMQRNRH